jgi:hypothetical protein
MEITEMAWAIAKYRILEVENTVYWKQLQHSQLKSVKSGILCLWLSWSYPLLSLHLGTVAYWGGSNPSPPPKFLSFDTVEPDCKLSGKCLVFLFQHPN